jgi:hypothetical protein
MLDDLMPDYDFSERHRRRIPASEKEVWDALTTITLADLSVTRPLVILRNLGSTPKQAAPLLTDGPVQLLDVTPGRHAVAGAVAQPWRPRARHHDVGSVPELLAFDQPGWTKYLTVFRVDPTNDGCVLSTETRGASTSSRARRSFALYWALIRIPSGIIRRDILRAVGTRATAPHDHQR